MLALSHYLEDPGASVGAILEKLGAHGKAFLFKVSRPPHPVKTLLVLDDVTCAAVQRPYSVQRDLHMATVTWWQLCSNMAATVAATWRQLCSNMAAKHFQIT